mgnify:CR=1 FL=1
MNAQLEMETMEDNHWDLMQEINRKLDILLARTAPKPKTVTKRSAIKHDYPEDFEQVNRAYPQRKPAGNKRAAFAAYSQRKQEGFTAQDILAGARRYRAYTDAEGLTGSKYVMMLSTFLGPRCEFENAWELPEPEVKRPQTRDEWLMYGQKNGIVARTGESWDDLIKRIQESLR